MRVSVTYENSSTLSFGIVEYGKIQSQGLPTRNHPQFRSIANRLDLFHQAVQEGVVFLGRLGNARDAILCTRSKSVNEPHKGKNMRKITYHLCDQPDAGSSQPTAGQTSRGLFHVSHSLRKQKDMRRS